MANYRKDGIKGLENKSRRPKTNPKEAPIRIKERIIELRKDNKCCAKKLAWKLEKEGIKTHYQTIQKIIRREGLTRKYRTRKIKYKYVKIPLRVGELVEIDVKYVPNKIKDGSCFTNRYTGYLKSSDPFNPRLHALDLLCAKLGIEHYLIDPGKPAQNGKVERSHRSDQESFYNQLKFKSFEELRYKLKLWNMCYNNLEHCGLNGKTPNQVLRSGVQYVCI